MTKHGLVTLDWGDGTYPFRLGLAEIEELEEKTGDGVFVIADHLATRSMRLKHAREVLRLGLIGGGMAPVPALHLVRRYLDARPLDENRDTALAVVLAGLARVHGDTLDVEALASGEAASGEQMGGKADRGSTLSPSTAQPA